MADAPDDRNRRIETDAARAAALFAVDPFGLGGVSLRARLGPARDAWLQLLRALLPERVPLLKLPGNIADDRLLGGLDLAATLASGRRIAERGLLAAADGGIILIPLAERLSATLAARIVGALDRGGVSVERDGLTQTISTQFGVVALDEGIDADERPPASLLDRLAIHLELDGPAQGLGVAAVSRADVEHARDRLPDVVVDEKTVEALCEAAHVLGIASLNAPHLALKAAQAAAALAGEKSVGTEHVALAARLVLAPRATTVPVAQAEEAEAPAEPAPDPADGEREGSEASLGEMAVAAALAAIPANLLASLRATGRCSARSLKRGRAGERRTRSDRGAPAGTSPGNPGRGQRLNVVETLRAAAPWQRLRPARIAGHGRVRVRPDDFRLWRCKKPSETVTIFVVDASGSSALNRLAEAKGAVEILLADCYVRRDQVAVLAFGGRGAELLLPPTRSLARAKRQLADLPGGGGTPLGAALEKAASLAVLVRRKQQTPAIVVLTDGKPNLSRDGRQGRQAGKDDALAAAAELRMAGIPSLVIDTSVQADPSAALIAETMGARYVPLPHADARAVSAVVRSGFARSET